MLAQHLKYARNFSNYLRCLKVSNAHDTVEPMNGKGKVFVGMSGGVDSSVSAALLKKEGYEVVGVFIKVWQADFLPCTWREERRDAMRAAAHIGIPFLTLDLEQEYKQHVVDYMIEEYSKGRVPNPDVMCNKHVKFGGFLKFAKEHDADLVATGHYAQKKEEGGQQHLYAGIDKEKDQSYFLWTLTQAQLAHTIFPIGHLTKPQVRLLAEEMKLPNATKKDSQGLCFMGPVDMAEFLKHYIDCTSGAVLDEEGKIIGTHQGAMLYTIGQRHGFSTEKATSSEDPYFVIRKDIAQNTITVAHRKPGERGETIDIEHLNDITGILQNEEEGILAEIRYHGTKYPVRIVGRDPEKNRLSIELHAEGEYIASGQSIVFYRNDECLGGGVIV